MLKTFCCHRKYLKNRDDFKNTLYNYNHNYNWFSSPFSISQLITSVIKAYSSKDLRRRVNFDRMLAKEMLKKVMALRNIYAELKARCVKSHERLVQLQEILASKIIIVFLPSLYSLRCRERAHQVALI